MSRRPRSSYRRRALQGAGLLVSAAGVSVSVSVAAQTQRTGWEDVKPTGWPSSAHTTTTASAPARTEVARATAAPRHAKASRSSRRRTRATGGRRPAAPAWISLEWDTPPPIDVALDWGPSLVDGRPLALIVETPEAPAPMLPGSVLSFDAAAVADEARLPVATMIHAAAMAPATPRPAAFARSRTGGATRAPGFRGFVTRLAHALGLRRAVQTTEETAPRVARVEGAATR